MVRVGFRFRAAEGVVHPDSAPCHHPCGRRSLRQIIFRAAYEKQGSGATGSGCLNYKLVEVDDLDFANPDQDPIPLSVATVGILAGNEVTTDVNGNATVQFILGTAKSTTFLRAETTP